MPYTHIDVKRKTLIMIMASNIQVGLVMVSGWPGKSESEIFAKTAVDQAEALYAEVERRYPE